MSTARPGSVLVTTDLTSSSLVGVPYAVALARRHGAKLDVVHVVIEYTDVGVPFPEGPVLDAHVEHMEREARRLMSEMDLGDVAGIDVEHHVVRNGSPAAGIADAARRFGSDVIVIASHGRRLLAQIVLGSVARNVVAAAPCPVLCVKSHEHGLLDPSSGELRLRRVLVATDLSESSARALPVAYELAAVHDGSVEVVYVAHVDVPPAFLGAGVESIFELDPDLAGRLEDRLERFVSAHHAAPPKVKLHVAEGAASKTIAARADAVDADLIVLTKHGAGKTPHLLGGVPERLLHDAHRPILVV